MTRALVGRRAGLVLVGLFLAACGGPIGSPSVAPSASVPALETLAPPTTSPSGPAASGSEAVVVDPSLLAILPSSVDGLAMTESADGEAEALKDPNLPKVASAVTSGLAIDTVSGDFVYAVVVRLLPGAMTDASYRDWRDSYDEGACSQADGVVGHAEATIGGRTVYIATCGGGVRTYHVWLEAQGVVISASAVGDQRRLGEKLVEGLRP